MRLLTALAVVMLSGCSGELAQSGPQATASPTRPLLVVQRAGEVAIIDLPGNSVAAYPLPSPASNGFVGVVGIGAADRRAVIYDTRNGELSALYDDGGTERLATLPGTPAFSQVHVGPTGQWAWIEESVTGTTIRTRLHIGGPAAGADRVVLELSDPSRVLRPYRWDAGGLVVEIETIGRMSSPVFDPAMDGVELVDVTTGDVHPLATPPGCWFAARAHDGTLACVSETASASTLEVISPGGSLRSFDLPRPAFSNVGNASFHESTSGEELLVGGDDGTRFATVIVELAGAGHLNVERPPGIAPAAGEGWVWLDDTLQVGTGWQSGVSTDAGVWLYGRDGTARHISSGTAIGVLSGA